MLGEKKIFLYQMKKPLLHTFRVTAVLKFGLKLHSSDGKHNRQSGNLSLLKPLRVSRRRFLSTLLTLPTLPTLPTFLKLLTLPTSPSSSLCDFQRR